MLPDVWSNFEYFQPLEVRVKPRLGLDKPVLICVVVGVAGLVDDEVGPLSLESPRTEELTPASIIVFKLVSESRHCATIRTFSLRGYIQIMKQILIIPYSNQTLKYKC